MFVNPDSSAPSFLSKIDDSPELESFLDSPDLTNPVNSFLPPDNTGISDEVSDLDRSSNIALKVDEGTGLEEGMETGGWGAQTVPLGNSAGSQGYRGIPAGTGSSGGVTPGGFTPQGGVTPGGEVNPGGVYNPGSNPKAPTARERTRRRKKAAESDKEFDCSRMEGWADPVGDSSHGDSSQFLMGRNPKSRFCCTGGPPTSGIWDGIFYTNSPGKFVTLRTNYINCTLIRSVIIINRAPF